ncbi:MAG TPA: hypothetical protein VG476_14630 [Acidimicrobiales bacterium]|nr:hypothetical protein [Acidimicrobiales bacterium]
MYLRPALEEVAAVGHCLVRRALTRTRTEELLGELAAQPFSPLEPVIGTVHQRGEGMTVDVDDGNPPAAGKLVSELADEVRASGIPGTSDYIPNEVTCQRYLDGASGIEPHMDQRRYRLLIAAFTLVGEAPFTVFEDRSATTVVRAWMTRAGDLCLLRAPGLAGIPDGRPTHSVGGPSAGARMSLTVRMNERMNESVLQPPGEG